MEILGVGPLEIVVILIIALLVFGPDRLPQIGASLGKAVRELRSLSGSDPGHGYGPAGRGGPGRGVEPAFPGSQPGDAGRDPGRRALSHPGQALEKALVGQLTSTRPSGSEAENTIAPPTPSTTPPSAPKPDDAPASAVDAEMPAAPDLSETDRSPSPAAEVEAVAGPAVSETDGALAPMTDAATPTEPSAGDADTGRTPVVPASAEPHTPSWEI